MAKKKRRGRPPGSKNVNRGIPESIGTALGNVAARLDGWMAQRQEIAHELGNVISRAQGMLSQLGTMEVPFPRRRGRPPATPPLTSGGTPRKRRKMSAAARKKISDAQKARWAAIRAGKAKRAK